jgi:hypothetical protein
MKKKLISLFVLSLFVLPFLTVQPVLASDPFGNNFVKNDNEGIVLGDDDPRTIAATVINVVLTLLSIIAVVIVLLGGFKWMTAAGNEEKVADAKKLLGAGVIGLAIILAAWGIASFALNKLGSATGAGGLGN